MGKFQSPFKIVDRSENPAPKEVYNWKLFFLVLSSIFGSGCYGYDGGFIGSTIVLKSFINKFGLEHDTNLSSNIVSTYQAGAFFGTLLSYFINRIVGRKLAMIGSCVLFEVGSILQTAAAGNVGMIYAGRCLNGLSVGTFSAIIPIFISEWAPPSIRGMCIGSYEVMYQSFQVIGFWINYGVNQHISDDRDAQWQIPFAFQLFPCTLMLATIVFQPESYRFLLKKGKTEKALKNLCYIRNLPEDHAYIEWEMSSAEAQIKQEMSFGTGWVSELKECFKKGIRSRILLGMAVMTLQNTCGMNTLNYYSNQIFIAIGFTGTSTTLLATGVFGLVKATTNYFAVYLGAEAVGRRKLIMYSSGGTIFAMMYLAGYTAVSGSFDHHVPRDAGAYFAIISIYLFAMCYTSSWNAVPFVYSAEIMTNKVRDIGMTIAVMTQWLAQFAIVYSTPYMMKNIKWGTFLFFGMWLVIGVFFCYFLMPETRGISLEEMDYMFNAKGFARQKRKEADRIIALLKEEKAGETADPEKGFDEQDDGSDKSV